MIDTTSLRLWRCRDLRCRAVCLTLLTPPLSTSGRLTSPHINYRKCSTSPIIFTAMATCDDKRKFINEETIVPNNISISPGSDPKGGLCCNSELFGSISQPTAAAAGGKAVRLRHVRRLLRLLLPLHPWPLAWGGGRRRRQPSSSGCSWLAGSPQEKNIFPLLSSLFPSLPQQTIPTDLKVKKSVCSSFSRSSPGPNTMLSCTRRCLHVPAQHSVLDGHPSTSSPATNIEREQQQLGPLWNFTSAASRLMDGFSQVVTSEAFSKLRPILAFTPGNFPADHLNAFNRRLQGAGDGQCEQGEHAEGQHGGGEQGKQQSSSSGANQPDGSAECGAQLSSEHGHCRHPGILPPTRWKEKFDKQPGQREPVSWSCPTSRALRRDTFGAWAQRGSRQT